MLGKILVSLLYLGILILFAVRARQKTKDIEDYYAGGRNVATVLVELAEGIDAEQRLSRRRKQASSCPTSKGWAISWNSLLPDV